MEARGNQLPGRLWRRAGSGPSLPAETQQAAISGRPGCARRGSVRSPEQQRGNQQPGGRLSHSRRESTGPSYLARGVRTVFPRVPLGYAANVSGLSRSRDLLVQGHRPHRRLPADTAGHCQRQARVSRVEPGRCARAGDAVDRAAVQGRGLLHSRFLRGPFAARNRRRQLRSAHDDARARVERQIRFQLPRKVVAGALLRRTGHSSRGQTPGRLPHGS